MRTLYHPEGHLSVWGIKCKFKQFREEEVEQAIKDGWFKSPVDFEEAKADTNDDGNVDFEEAKAYAVKHNLDISGLHWKKAVSLVKDHINGNSKD